MKFRRLLAAFAILSVPLVASAADGLIAVRALTAPRSR